MLIAEHSAAIEREPRRLKRWARTISAIFYGLAKRLAPHRRLLFVLSFVAFFACLFGIFRSSTADSWLFVEVAATFLLMTLLLAMELIDKVKYRDELQLARDLQASLIPKTMPSNAEWDIAASTASPTPSAATSTTSCRSPTGGWRCCSATPPATAWPRGW